MSSFIELMVQSLPSLLKGLQITLIITIISLFFASIIGMLMGLFSVGHSKALKGLAKSYVNIIRGTPLIVQAFFLYFGIPSLINGLRIPALVAGIIVISVNSGAYMSEIFRGGIESIHNGQMEAARSLGMNYKQAMVKVILPQAIRRMIPAMLNQFIISLKDTSLLTVIGVRELTQSGQIIIATNFRSLEIWFVVGLIYFIVIMGLTAITRRIESRLEIV